MVKEIIEVEHHVYSKLNQFLHKLTRVIVDTMYQNVKRTLMKFLFITLYCFNFSEKYRNDNILYCDGIFRFLSLYFII